MKTKRESTCITLLLLPTLIIFIVFFVVPLVMLILRSSSEGNGLRNYVLILTTPRYIESILYTTGLSLAVTVTTIMISGIIGFFLSRNEFKGKSLLISLMTFPLAFPGVVVGLMVILLAGRLGVVGKITEALFGEKLVFAYSLGGLFLGYIYFSIPRILLTMMASVEKLDASLEEAGRSMGASRLLIIKDILIPAMRPAIVTAGAIGFATSMGAFGTAFTLATDINVIPMTIYTEFTLNANIGMASALSVVLGVVSWLVLYCSRAGVKTTGGV